ncbi:MAG: hypothetical protein OQK82_00630 [Candidatus Pacearchaeota archaeon]|nr:hypothetical protein [Candidatus Pacearchaeota archaeon]
MITIETKKNKNLSKIERNVINKARVNEWGKDEKKDFLKDYEPNTLWFFVRDEKRVVSVGGLRPVKIKYLGRSYYILGICSIISLVKGKDYGRILISTMIHYFNKTGKSALGFTGKTEFFEKVGLGVKKNFICKFVYVNPKTKKKTYDSDGDGIFYNGKDNFIEKIIDAKSDIEINILHW